MATIHIPVISSSQDDKYFEINGILRMNYLAAGITTKEEKVKEVYDEKLGFSRLYIKGGKLGGYLLVLIADDYGAGWSTNSAGKYAQHLLMDSRVVLFFYKTYIAPLQLDCECDTLQCVCDVSESPMRDFLKSIGLDTSCINLAGISKLKIGFVPPNKTFCIQEYDGYESIIFPNENWYTS